jgi:tetratricopeptide (TPR) repeat protein
MRYPITHTILLISVLLLPMAVQSHAQGQQTKADALKLFTAGETFMENNDWEAALKSFNTCLRIDPAFADAYYARGLVHEYFKSWPEALTDFSINLTYNPDHNEALFKRAQLHYKLGHYALAQEDFLKLLTMPTGETSTVFFEQGNFNGGVNQIFTAQGNGKKRIYNWLGLTETNLKDYPKALMHFDSAIRLSPTDPDLYVNKGIAFERKGAHTEAIAAYTKALALDPKHGLANVNLQTLRSKLNRSSSTSLLDSAILNNPHQPYAYAERGYIHLQDGAYQLALADYNEAIRINPKDADYFLNRGIIHEKLKQHELAYKDYSMALHLDERMASAWLNRGNVLLHLKKEKLAIEDYSAAISFEEDYAAAYYNRGIAYIQLKEYAQACNNLKTAKRLGHNVPSTLESRFCSDKP